TDKVNSSPSNVEETDKVNSSPSNVEETDKVNSSPSNVEETDKDEYLNDIDMSNLTSAEREWLFEYIKQSQYRDLNYATDIRNLNNRDKRSVDDIRSIGYRESQNFPEPDVIWEDWQKDSKINIDAGSVQFNSKRKLGAGYTNNVNVNGTGATIIHGDTNNVAKFLEYRITDIGNSNNKITDSGEFTVTNNKTKKSDVVKGVIRGNTLVIPLSSISNVTNQTNLDETYNIIGSYQTQYQVNQRDYKGAAGLQPTPQVIKVNYRDVKTGKILAEQDIFGKGSSNNDEVNINFKKIDDYQLVGYTLSTPDSKENIFSEDYGTTERITKQKKAITVWYNKAPQADQYDPEAGSIKKPYGEPTTEDEVTNEVTIPGYPEDGEQP
ncbi:hypothetical protein WMC59_12690, partial [Staphylococcus delphini]|uniref:hypothetical protein n=1 Tax=Staphylococcus delphini TaxID=53344 RepID=UPI00374E71ED